MLDMGGYENIKVFVFCSRVSQEDFTHMLAKEAREVVRVLIYW